MFADAAAKKIKVDLRNLEVDATFTVRTMRRQCVLVDISGVPAEWLYNGGEMSEDARALQRLVENIAQAYRNELPNPYPYDTIVTFDYKIRKPELQAV